LLIAFAAACLSVLTGEPSVFTAIVLPILPLIDAANFFAAELLDAIAAAAFRAGGAFVAGGRAVLTTTADRLVSAALTLAALASPAPPLSAAPPFRLVLALRLSAARCDFALAIRAGAAAFPWRRDRETGCFAAAFAGRVSRDFFVIPNTGAAAATIVAEALFTPTAFFATRLLETCLTCCFFLVFLVDDMS
jgi:hypothetical protein